MWNRSLSGLDSRRSRKDDGEAEQSREERRFCICDRVFRSQQADNKLLEISNIWIYWGSYCCSASSVDPGNLPNCRWPPSPAPPPSSSPDQNGGSFHQLEKSDRQKTNYSHHFVQRRYLKSRSLITKQEEEQSGRTAGLRRRRKNSPRFL